MRESLGLRPDDRVLVYVAELNQNKNQTVLLDMLSLLCKTYPNTKLMLIGDGAMKEPLLEKATRLNLQDNLILTGRRSDVPDLLKAADIAVPSSIREGFGLNVIEAMASNLPTVASNNRGHHTIIKDGKNGYLVPTGDWQAMAEKVAYLFEHPEVASRMVAAAYDALSQYTADSVTRLMDKIYLEQMKERLLHSSF